MFKELRKLFFTASGPTKSTHFILHIDPKIRSNTVFVRVYM